MHKIAPHTHAISIIFLFNLPSGPDASPNEYKSIAVYFECERNSLMAGKFFLYAKQYAKLRPNTIIIMPTLGVFTGLCAAQSNDFKSPVQSLSKMRLLTLRVDFSYCIK